MDVPNARKVHTTPVPRMGGVVIYFAFVVPMLLIWYFDRPQQGIIIGSFIALLIGMADDIWGVSAVLKLVVLFIATLLIREFGVVTQLNISLWGVPAGVFNVIITMLWITGMCSAINALDHMDGLAAGVSTIAALAYLTVSLQTGQRFWGLMAASLIGSLLGFLIYNRHPAKIFMGDSGSFFLGFSLASIGVMGGWSTNPIKAVLVPTAVLSVPIFDLAYVIFARRLNGTTKSIRESIVYCGKDHIGHRLCDMGFSQVSAVRIVYLMAGTIAISAIISRPSERFDFESLFLMLQIVMIYSIVLILMGIGKQSFRRKSDRD